MKVRVCFMGVIANVTGDKELELTFAERPTLGIVLDELERRYGQEFGARVFRKTTPPRLLQMCMRLFVNGNLVKDGLLDEPLPGPSDGDSPPEVLVYLLPAACGG